MSEMLMQTLELNSRDFVAINERLWNRLFPVSSNQNQQFSVAPGNRRYQPLPPGAPAATAATTAPKLLASPYPAEPPLAPPQRLPPLPLLSLFSEDGSNDDDDDDEPGGGGYHNRRSSGPVLNRTRPPSSSRGRSLRPREWPDIRRGGSGSKASPKETGQDSELEYFTPSGGRKGTTTRRYHPDERDGPPSSGGRRGTEPDEAGRRGAAGSDGPEERRNIYGGLGHVKKRLWGSMFEAAGASIKRRANFDAGSQENREDTVVPGVNGDSLDEDGTAETLTRGTRRQRRRRTVSGCTATAVAAAREGAGQSGTDDRALLDAHHQHRFPPLPRAAGYESGAAACDFVDAGNRQSGANRRRGKNEDVVGERESSKIASRKRTNSSRAVDSAGGSIDGSSSGSSKTKAGPDLDKGETTVRGTVRRRPTTGDHEDGKSCGGEEARGTTPRRARMGGGIDVVRTPRDEGASGSGRGIGMSSIGPRMAGVHGSTHVRDRFPPPPGGERRATRKAEEQGGPTKSSFHPLRGNQAQGHLQVGSSSLGRPGSGNGPEVGGAEVRRPNGEVLEDAKGAQERREGRSPRLV